MISKPDRLQEAACCLLAAARTVMERYGLPLPGADDERPEGRFHFSHKGLDDHCEDCSSVWVSLGESTGAEESFGDRCAGMRAWSFQLDILRRVCTESAGLDGCGDGYGGCLDGDGGCAEAVPIPEGADPCKKPDITVAEESALFWRERYVIEKEILEEFTCCLEKCHQIRCQGVELGLVTEATEGGCHYLTAEITAAF